MKGEQIQQADSTISNKQGERASKQASCVNWAKSISGLNSSSLYDWMIEIIDTKGKELSGISW